MPTINSPYTQQNTGLGVKFNPTPAYNPNQLFQQNGQPVSNFYDYSQQQVQNYGNQLMDFNSPLYQQFQSYLQSVTPGIGVNTLMSPLLASGASGDSAKNIANIRAGDLAQKRNESINQSVQSFALGNLSQIPGLLGQFSGNLQNQQNLTLQNDLRRDANSPLSGLGSLLGLVGNFIPGLGSGGVSGGGGMKLTPNYYYGSVNP